jgi:hypothetical protein
MAVKVEAKPIIVVEPNGKRVAKRKYKNSDLPFPPGRLGDSYTAKWRKEYKATITDWAGTVIDPFGTNSRLDLSEGANLPSPLEQCWMAIYPDLESCLNNPAERKAIVSLVSGVSVSGLHSNRNLPLAD